MAMAARALDGVDGIEHRICATAQHREMLDSVLDLFDPPPRYDLDAMSPDQDLTHLTQAVPTGTAPILQGVRLPGPPQPTHSQTGILGLGWPTARTPASAA